ncbi:gamma-soluble NSF attachment protein [Parasteatoda tepidariorum]|uniref:gamma-soluble NSF attachment protein n=1 Tax=Parasteatoda tepidariorum TaxID=114398 RepID=UPI00077FC817|nr:gamma-soluble NSF attachment protein [Parasteatoda tepidariorum]
MNSPSKNLDQANQSIREAEKFLKTSFLKWKPDYDNAASEYVKAATHFKSGKLYTESRDSFMKAADCYAKNNSFFSAAKNYEQAALISKCMEDYKTAIDLIHRACQLFREHGTPDTAALTLDRGAKMVESKNPEVALQLYIKAADVVMIEDRPTQASEFVGKAARILVKLRRFDDAADMVKKEMEYHLQTNNTRAAGRLVVAQVLIHLMREDYVAADKAFKEGCNYCERDECGTLLDILEGFDQGDAEQLNRGLNSPFIKHMDVEFARLARSLLAETEESEKVAKKKTANSSNAQGQDEEDEYAEGLL